MLSNVTLEAESGRVLALAGANGSGKTTLLRAALGLIVPRAGKLLADGVDLRDFDRSAWRKRIGYLPQRPHLAQRWTISLAMSFTTPDLDEPSMEKALRRVGVWDRIGSLSTKVGTLSAGERQRVALARVLARDVQIFFLDEPDANLDVAGISMVGEIVRELAQRGALVVFAAHTPELLQAADVLLTVNEGRISVASRQDTKPRRVLAG